MQRARLCRFYKGDSRLKEFHETCRRLTSARSNFTNKHELFMIIRDNLRQLLSLASRTVTVGSRKKTTDYTNFTNSTLPSSLCPHPSALIAHHSSLITRHSSLIPLPSSLCPHRSVLVTHHSSLCPHRSAALDLNQ